MNLKLNDLIPHKISKKTSIKHLTLKLAAFVLSEVLWVTCVYGQSGSAYTGLFIDTNKAVLQGLDKTTARVSTFELNINERGTFGTLIIKVRACRKRPRQNRRKAPPMLKYLTKKSVNSQHACLPAGCLRLAQHLIVWSTRFMMSGF